MNATKCGNAGYTGCGTVFELDTSGKETVLHNFNIQDGANPSSALIMDANGDLYGTTQYGGSGNCHLDGSPSGCGVVFKVSGRKETVMHSFNGLDGLWPWAGLIMDTSGVLYGTTYYGGNPGAGVVFKLVGHKETVLHNFCAGDCKDGANPEAGLIMDAKGNLYGTTPYGGGDINCDYPYPCGVVFKLAGTKETVLHNFRGSPDGATPASGLTMDANGNLYGTTASGGNNYDLGTVFEVSARGKERVLYRFGPPLDHAGFNTRSRVIRDAEGNLYGTTPEGGKFNAGIVFELSKDGKEKVLHDFCSVKNCTDGIYPYGDLIMDAKGNIYGTAGAGGANGNGTIFKITP